MKDYSRERRHVLIAWIALVLLMLSSLASAYVPMGPGNFFAGVGIATIKTAIVAWLYMRLREAGGLMRVVAIAGIGAWFLLVFLSGLDYATRPDAAVPWQSPQQLKSVVER